MIKKIVIIFSVLLVLMVALAAYGIHRFNNAWFQEKANYLEVQNPHISAPMEWAAGKFGDYIEPHNIIKIPVQLEGLPHHFFLQFDTGAPHTKIYRKPLESLKELGVTINERRKESGAYLEDFPLKIGEQSLASSRIPVYENYGRSFSMQDTLKPIKLGTIGADLLEDRIVVMDFAKQQLQIFAERPAWMDTLSNFQKFSFAGRRIMLPAEIRGKKYDLFYDSGSSAFGLITNRHRFKKYVDPQASPIRYDANSWGNAIPICHQASELTIKFGSEELPLQRVSYMDRYNWAQTIMAPFSTIGGWLGNKPFVNATLILDAQEEEFVIL